MKLIVILALLSAVTFNAVYADAGHVHKHPANSKQTKVEDNLGICPVMHNKAAGDYSYTYKGKTYYFCCQDCIELFKNNPGKYISKIKEVNLEAYQYGFSPDTIKVKQGDIVKIILTSRDVVHGFAIKEYNIKVRVKKGEAEKVEFIADKAGEFAIKCSVYCGEGHSRMRAKLIVEK